MDNINEAINEAVKQDAESTAVVTVTLSAPFNWCGSEFDSLHFDFEKLTGEDAAAIETEIRNTQMRAILVPSLDGEFLIRAAVRACTENIGMDAMKKLPIREYNKIRNAARAFFMG